MDLINEAKRRGYRRGTPIKYRSWGKQVIDFVEGNFFEEKDGKVLAYRLPKNERKTFNDERYDTLFDGHNWVEIVKTVNSEIKMKDNNGWTKIEEERPELSDYYDVYLSDGSVYKEIYYDEDGFDFEIDQSIVDFLNIVVTHYRKPYQYKPPIY